MDRLLRIIDLALEKKGISAAKASKLAVGNTAMIKNIRLGQKPSFPAVEKLFSVLGVNLDYGIGFGEPHDSAPNNIPQASKFSAKRELPNHGLAKCGIVGWFNDRDDGSLPAPEGLNDPEAFYVRASGLSMQPEGIPRGSFCLVSPQTSVNIGDRVYVLDGEKKVSIKRLVDKDDVNYYLRGWQSPRGGKQTSYNDQRLKQYIKKIYPVVAVFRHRPEAGQKPELIPDPKRNEFGGEDVRAAGWRIPENTDTVPLYGFAGAGGEVAYDGELHHGEMASAPPGESKYLAAVEVRGDSAAPYLREGDRIYFNPDYPASPEQHIGRLVLATTTGGAAYIKILRRGDTEGKWNLQSINPRHPLMEDVELQRISPFIWIHYNGRETPFKKM